MADGPASREAGYIQPIDFTFQWFVAQEREDCAVGELRLVRG